MALYRNRNVKNILGFQGQNAESLQKFAKKRKDRKFSVRKEYRSLFSFLQATVITFSKILTLFDVYLSIWDTLEGGGCKLKSLELLLHNAVMPP